MQSVQSALSDPHRGGRTVKIITFENGRKIVYKPKSLAIDEAWANLSLGWTSTNPPSTFAHRRPGTAPPTVGSSTSELPHAKAAKRCETSTLAPVCCRLLYGVIATDFHHENLIVSADQPVPMTSKTYFVPRLTSRTADTDQLLQRFLATVLQCQMLPSW